MTTFWTAQHLQKATLGTWQGPPLGDHTPLGRIAIDTRQLQKGEVYIALHGVSQDGHRFIPQAIEAGACAIIAADASCVPATVPALIVGDTLRAFHQLASYARDHIDARRIAITGSVGKTSIKELLLHMLSSFGPTWASPKSYNNHWGVPFTMANMPSKSQFGVFELGTNAQGEIEPLSKLVRPHVALLSTIGVAHRANFPTPHDLTIEKCALFQGLVPGGVAILPKDCDVYGNILDLAKKLEAIKILTFAEHGPADIRIRPHETTVHGLKLAYDVGGQPVTGSVPLYGHPWVYNIGAALSVLYALGLDPQRALDSLSTFQEPEGRGRLHRLHAPRNKNAFFTLVDQAYNANPQSMKAALRTFQTLPTGRGRRIAVLGDMFELGTPEETQVHHLEILEAIDADKLDMFIAVGPYTQVPGQILEKKIPCFFLQDASDLGHLLLVTIEEGDCVMLKAGHKMGFTQVVESIVATCKPDDAPANNSINKTLGGAL